MNEVQQTCPLPGGPPPIADECNVTKTVSWSTPSTVYVNYFIQTTDDTILRFKFTPISNNGSNIFVFVIYGDNGVREVKSTYNLGNLPTEENKYHVLNLGSGFRTNQVITFQFVFTSGTSGSLNLLVDCDVDVCFTDLCYLTVANSPTDLCWECPTIVRVYWDCEPIKNFFPPAEIFLDPELSIEAPIGFYRIINTDVFPIIYYYDGNKLVKQDACGTVIDCDDSIILEHKKGDYKYATAKISGVPEKNATVQVGVNRRGDPILGQINLKNVNYSIKEVIVWFPTTTPGYTTITFSIAGGDYEDACFTVSDANAPRGQVGYLSYSIVGVPAYEAYNPPFSPDSLIRLQPIQNSITVRVYFNGGNQLTQALRIRAAVGQKKRYKKNNTIQTTISASCITSIYSYRMGVHTYSPYDAVSATSKNTTVIYAKEPINQWQEERTILYSDPLLSFPAFPWYYGYENYVYQVQHLYLREVGSKRTYQIKSSMAGRLWRWITFQGNRINLTQFDSEVKNWLAESYWGGDYHEELPTCLWTEMEWGRLNRIFDENENLYVPTSYFYFLGYNSNNKNNSLSQYFTATQIPSGVSYPIGGLQHLLFRSRINNYSLNRTVPGPDWFYYPFNSWASDVLVGGTIVVNTIIIASYIYSVFAASSSGLIGTTLTTTFSFCPEPVTCAIIVLVIITVLLLIEFFKIHRITVEEDCDPPFLIGYSDTPYIEVGSTIYYNKNLTIVKDGFYSDGAYFYTQNGGVVVTKEQAEFYDTQVGTAPGTFQKVPLPDQPSFIQAIPNLYFLCYVSGRPVYNWNYTSPQISSSIIKNNLVGDLFDAGETTYTLPAGQFGSNISQEDADAQAISYFSGLTAGTVFDSSSQKPGVATQFLDFTHELKIENFPSTYEYLYDNSDTNGITVGKKIYYDDEGFFSVLTGFYSKDADDEINYKFFYEVSAGTVVDIWTMSSSTATQVISQETSQVENLVQSYLNYTSSWYFFGQRYEWLGQNATSSGYMFESGDTWNSTNFYNNTGVVRGFIDTPSTYDTFYLYDNNFTIGTFSQAPEGYFSEIPLLNNSETFSYLTGQTLTLNIVQECSETPELNGIRINCVDEDGELTPATNGVQFNLIIYLNSGTTGDNEYYSYDVELQSVDFEKFINLDVSLIGQIKFAEISTILSTNPIGKTLYTGGTFTECLSPTPTPTNVIWTLTPTPSNTSTPTPTASITPTVTQTPTIGSQECDEYYNNTSNPLNGINYTDCFNIAYAGITVNAGDGICVLQGTLNGGDSGFLTNIGSCGTYNPSFTPTPTITQTITQTKTPAPTPTTAPSLYSILLTSSQSNACDTCYLSSYTTTAYTESNSLVPVVDEIIYTNSNGSSIFSGASLWYKTEWAGNPFADYTIKISNDGVILEIVNCGACPTTTPSTTPTQTPTMSSTPNVTPTVTPTPTTSGAPSLYVASSATNACNETGGTSLPTFTYGGTQTLCGCDTINAANVSGLALGSYFVSDGVNSRPFSKNSAGTTLTQTGSCTIC